MSGRPRFNLHQERKFWSGLGILLLFTGLWVAAGRFHAGLAFVHSTSQRYGRASAFLSAGCLDFAGWFVSGVNTSGRTGLRASRPFSVTLREHREMKLGFIFWLESHSFRIAIPLWIPPLLWSVLWLRWMVRAARDEAKRRRNAPM